ncbi:MAG: DUF499 domain-containing protein [Myxococcota bacterium]|nr:DUF499 domain-containing protein [Myxococcota bacterium]
MSGAHELKPWVRVAVPHDDIVAGNFALSMYAANLGQVDSGDKRCPEVYRDPVAFFRATHMTKALDDLLRGVAHVLTGGDGNRVLQLRTPFGGGKTHTLIGLLHLLRHRDRLDAEKLLPKAKGTAFPNPGKTIVATLPGLDLDAASGRHVGNVHLKTLWGELAWRIGGAEAFNEVATADAAGVQPGGDKMRKLLGDKPVLILMDEALVYVEAALGITVGDTNLGRQTMGFLQILTEVVSDLPHAALVYSLQQSTREALGDEGLLQTLDSLVSRRDAKKEPVTGDDVLQVVRRRLFKDIGPHEVHVEVAKAYGALLESFLGTNAQTDGERRAAGEQGKSLERRIAEAYPFHPELLDLMYLRWGSLPTYQRTRGALQFLATVIGAIWRSGEAGPLIAPGDVPFDDADVRNSFFTQVGERESMNSVLDSDVTGGNARCGRVDSRFAEDAPVYKSLRPASRLARAVTLYSFGAKQGEDRGVVRSDLLAAVQQPGLTADVLDVCLQQLTETLLYIHSTGRRYRFEKKPNLNKMIDDAAHKFEGDEVQAEVRRWLEKQIGVREGYVVWPAGHDAVPDRKPRFHVVFLGPDLALRTRTDLEKVVLEWTENRGDNKRQYRNALVFALPAAGPMDEARAAARMHLAITHLLDEMKAKRVKLETEDEDDLKARLTAAGKSAEAAVRKMYPTLLLPVAAPESAKSPMRLEAFEIQEYQAAGAGLLDNILRQLANWVFEERIQPRKLIDCLHLGEGDPGGKGHWTRGPEVTDLFFGSVQFPKLMNLDTLRGTIAAGVQKGLLGYVMGATEKGDALTPRSADSVTYAEKDIEPGDIDLSAGSYLVSADLAKKYLADFGKPEPVVQPPRQPEVERSSSSPPPPATPGTTGKDRRSVPPPGRREVRLEFETEKVGLFKAFRVLQLLSDWADAGFEASVRIQAKSSKDLDQHWYETAIVDALDEEGVGVKKP